MAHSNESKSFWLIEALAVMLAKPSHFTSFILPQLTLTLFFLWTATTALAFGEIRYPDRPLNIRSARSAAAPWVGNLQPGQKVRVAFEQDGWVALFEPGETRGNESLTVGYANVSFLLPEPKRVEPHIWGEPMVAISRLNIRSGASIRSACVGKLEEMERVKVDFPEDDWVMIFHPDSTIRSRMNARGYCAANFLESVVALVREAPTHKERLISEATAAEVDLSSERQGINAQATERQPREAVAVPGQVGPLDSSNDIGSAPDAPEFTPILEDAVPSKPVVTHESGKQTLVHAQTKLMSSKRGDPTPNKTAHGYQYRLLEKSETKKKGVNWITLKTFLSTDKLPNYLQLKDFCTTLWNEHRRITRNLTVLVYLPGMDMDDLAYGVVSFDDKALLEVYVRRVSLLGTSFL